MASPLENLSGPGKVLAAEPADAEEFAGLKRSGLVRLKDADWRLTRHMQEELAAAGVHLSAVEHCPHLPDAKIEGYRLDCSCRKPKPGMLERAAIALNIDLAASILVGDRASDIQAGRSAGVGRCWLVRSGQPLCLSAIELSDGVYENLSICAQRALKEPAPQSPGMAQPAVR
jgi:D-glycero-D-manno-heptose 1,7-bisphosphate phosphatase